MSVSHFKAKQRIKQKKTDLLGMQLAGGQTVMNASRLAIRRSYQILAMDCFGCTVAAILSTDEFSCGVGRFDRIQIWFILRRN